MNQRNRILVVDDSDENREAVAGLLTANGYVVDTASNGETALLQVATVTPDLCIIDITMPQMNGLELLEKLRVADNEYEAIMMTGHETIDDAKTAMERGAFSYLNKPIRWETLNSHVLRALDLVQLKRNRMQHLTELTNQIHRRTDELQESVMILQDQRSRLDSIINCMQEGMLAIDTQNRIIHMNPQMEKILGVRYADCTGKNFGEIVDNLDNLVCLASLTSQLHRADEAGCLISLRVSGGTTSTYCANIQDWTDAKGGSIGRVITFLDQTEKQKAEQLRLHFLSVVAHELRTPTTVIRNYLPIVSNESNKEIIGDMESATRRLERVVFNLVSLTKFSDVSAHAQKNVVNIFDISAARIKELQKDADAKPVLINLVNNMHSPLVNTDADIVGIALSNLIDNAIKFNSQLGSIQVILNDLSTLHEPGFSITVTDTGPGICGRARAHLFHCFSQGEHHLNRFYGGMGTGLFLVKRAAELLGGSIALDWTSNAGSSFTLSIPACEADHITQPPSAANPVS